MKAKLIDETTKSKELNQFMTMDKKVRHTPTGIELIAKERREQIKKHGFTKKSDKLYVNGELVQAALCCLEKVGRGPGFTNVKHKWPAKWSTYFEKYKIRNKDDVGKLTVAGAFYMAENDRLGNDFYVKEINEIAARIDVIKLAKDGES